MRFDARKHGKAGAASVALAAAFIVGAGTAQAQTGGAFAPGGAGPTSSTPGVAKLAKNGAAIPPPDAPKRVRKMINAGNKIRRKPYRWGGGHRSFKAKGYDCSGAVSFVLRAGGLLKRPLSSGPLGSKWGKKGVGRWVTVYGNKNHAYMVVAGLRFDTSAVGESLRRGSGPRWRHTHRSPKGYNARFALGSAAN